MIVGFLILVLLSGCQKDDDFIVSVNGRRLTQAEIDRNVKMMVSLRARSAKNIPSGELVKFPRSLESTYPILFERDAIIGSYAAEQGIVTSDALLGRYRKSAVRGLKPLKVKDWEGVSKVLGEDFPLFSARVDAEAREQAVRDYWVSQTPTNFSVGFAEGRIDQMKQFNRNMDASNVLIRARAEKAYGELKGGVDFKTVAARWSELEIERKDKGKWALLDWKQIESDKELNTWAKKLKPGEYSPPIEADNGLMILRVDRKDSKECKMSRIFFQLPMYYQIPTVEELIKQAEKDYAWKLFEEKFAELKAKAVIVKGKQNLNQKEEK